MNYLLYNTKNNNHFIFYFTYIQYIYNPLTKPINNIWTGTNNITLKLKYHSLNSVGWTNKIHYPCQQICRIWQADGNHISVIKLLLHIDSSYFSLRRQNLINNYCLLINLCIIHWGRVEVRQFVNKTVSTNQVLTSLRRIIGINLNKQKHNTICNDKQPNTNNVGMIPPS
jgi:hypothetical protein